MQLDFSVRKISSTSPATKNSYFWAQSYEEVAVDTRLFNSNWRGIEVVSILFIMFLWLDISFLGCPSKFLMLLSYCYSYFAVNSRTYSLSKPIIEIGFILQYT